MSEAPEQTRAMPAKSHISELENRLQHANKLLLDNVKDLQIVRSQLTGLSHAHKESLNTLRLDTEDCLADVQADLKLELDTQQNVSEEFKKLLKTLAGERFVMMQEVLLLNKRVEGFEDEFGGPRM
jgi:phage-related tail protein